MDWLERHSEPGSMEMQRRIKKALDPAGVIAPGRYIR